MKSHKVQLFPLEDGLTYITCVVCGNSLFVPSASGDRIERFNLAYPECEVKPSEDEEGEDQ